MPSQDDVLRSYLNRVERRRPTDRTDWVKRHIRLADRKIKPRPVARALGIGLALLALAWMALFPAIFGADSYLELVGLLSGVGGLAVILLVRSAILAADRGGTRRTVAASVCVGAAACIVASIPVPEAQQQHYAEDALIAATQSQDSVGLAGSNLSPDQAMASWKALGETVGEIVRHANTQALVVNGREGLRQAREAIPKASEGEWEERD